jgi:hypothetical protein
MTTSAMDFPRGWSPPGDEEVWGDVRTYYGVPFEALPPLTGLDGSFAWLRTVEERGGMFFYQNHRPPPLEARVAEARRAGLTIPPAFLTFFNDETLYERIPSCTACYYEIGSRLVSIPDLESSSRLLRFMNAQQLQCLWYLLLHPDGSHEVATSIPEWLPSDSDDDGLDDHSLDDQVIPRDIVIASPSFEEFIKRTWIENTIWELHVHKQPIEGELHAYREAARAAVACGRAKR